MLNAVTNPTQTEGGDIETFAGLRVAVSYSYQTLCKVLSSSKRTTSFRGPILAGPSIFTLLKPIPNSTQLICSSTDYHKSGFIAYDYSRNMKQMICVKETAGEILDIAYDKKNERVALFSVRNKAAYSLYDTCSWKLLKTAKSNFPKGSVTCSLTFDPEGALIAALSQEGILEISPECTDGSLLRIQTNILETGHHFCRWNPLTSTIALGSRQGNLEFMDPNKVVENDPTKIHFRKMNALEWHGDGYLLASCSDDRSIKIFDIRTRRIVKKFDKHREEIQTLCWSESGDSLVFALKDNTVQILNFRTGKLIKSERVDSGLMPRTGIEDFSLILSTEGSSTVSSICFLDSNEV